MTAPTHTAAHRHPLMRPTVYLSAVALPLIAACSDAPVPEIRVTPVPVTVADATTSDSTALVTATGSFGSRDEIPLGFKIGGIATRVLVDEGATVQRGQVLAMLDLREIDAAVNKAQVAVDKAQRDQQRVQRLAADSVATLAQAQDAMSALEAARADLASARVNREYAIITAPEAGVVLQRLVTPGSNVAPGTPVLMLGGSRRGRVLRAGLPDRDALRVHVGDPAMVRFDALPGKSFTGKVVLVGRSADPRTGTYAVEVAVQNADALPSGLVGQMSVTIRGKQSASLLPVDALLEADRDSATVYTVQRGSTPTAALTAAPQRIRVTGIEGDRAAISGLPANARVITRGAAYVTPGAPIRIITTATLDSMVPSRTITATPTLAARNGGHTP
ncbi:efflux RND transporter periplasmic adaptor subunit [Gemmatimonas sp.]|uniref:efflux RND transporter periplasmic adaptor subunit n=1 Tax=Gemmatimonas sp. TaxID=1962908 RepID=UPI003340B4CD